MARKSIGIVELDFENGSLAENWKRWKQTMKLTLQLGPLAEKDEKQQCGYFLLYIGQKGRDIYNTWALKSAEIDKIDALFDRFEAYCIPKQNVTVLRYKFNTRDQRSDENIDQYVTELRRLANDCSYGELLEEMIRDRIVCGTNNPQIKEKLLQAETLDLSRAINIARGIEISSLTLIESLPSTNNCTDISSFVSLTSLTTPIKKSPSSQLELLEASTSCTEINKGKRSLRAKKFACGKPA